MTALAVLVLALAPLAGCASEREPRGGIPIQDLGDDGIEGFLSAFNAAAGQTRLVALLSPT